MKKNVLYSFLIFLIFCITNAFLQDYYWENPEYLINVESHFPTVASNKSISIVMWQEVEPITNDSGNIFLSMQIFVHESWHITRKFAGPFYYSGEIPSIASCMIDNSNRILVSAVSPETGVSLYVSHNLGISFSEQKFSTFDEALLSPKIFQSVGGGYLLFATKGESENFTLVYSYSNDGIRWEPFKIFPPTKNLRNAFLPTHATIFNSDIIVFQAWHEANNRFSYQLYLSQSLDGGKTWDSPQIISFINEPGIQYEEQATVPTMWHNQRPFLKTIQDTVYLTWERSTLASQKYAIYFAQLSKDKTMLENSEKVSFGDGDCYAPNIIELKKNPAVLWFDNRKGVNRIYMAEKIGYIWNENEISENNRDALFGQAVTVGNDLEIYWQQNISATSNRIVKLATDRSVQKPKIEAVNYQTGKKSQNSTVRFLLQIPEDSSGIAGYSYAWRQGRNPEVLEILQYLPEQTRITENALSDGSWFLGVKVLDYAGNWSEPTYIEFVRDTTPPIPPKFVDFSFDSFGFFASNTGSIRWEPAEKDDIAGYTWSFEYLAPVEYLQILHETIEQEEYSVSLLDFDFQKKASLTFKPSLPSSSLKTTKGEISFTNVDNGIYALSVSAIDDAGNIGSPAIQYFVFNKYIPYTYITYIDSKVDPTGIVSLSIIGRGFLDGGILNKIIIDRDGKEPWDLELELEQNHYKIVNDRLVSNISFTDLDEGIYRIILNHTKRGLYTSNPILGVTEYGTVKFGDFNYAYVPPWKITNTKIQSIINPSKLVLWSGIFFGIIVLIFSIVGLTHTSQEMLLIRKEFNYLLMGDSMVKDRKKSTSLRVKGIGLKFKLAFFTGTLVFSVVLIVSIPLGMQFSANQEQTLAEGLESKVNVLLDSLASGARAYLPSQNILELGFLPDQITALSEAKTATITGHSSDGSMTGLNFVWATNDPLIQERIDTPQLNLGRSKLEKEENSEILRIIESIEKEAFVAVHEISESITLLTQEGRSLALKTDPASVQRRDEIQTITRQLEEKLNVELTRLSTIGTGSWPRYNPSALSREHTSYTFFKPVMFRQGADTNYVRGTVRIEISTESLLEMVDKDRQTLIETTALTALIAVAIGILGSLILASVIISPVLRLANHVAMIRDTEDKEELEGKDIILRSKDEIGLLGETINDMTRGLVKAAAASKDLTVGKEVQKMFIPLDTDSMGRKLTSGSSQDKNATFFGYYEGAKGVSGDYFDYIKLDERHYAIIKCDVAGKGVPAALIMVEVATLFLDYFKDWSYKKHGYNLSYIVTRINDLIESRGFQGRFAAFTLCIFDSVSGDIHFCNAGDNLVHIFDSTTRRMKVITLPESSAAGVFPSELVDMKGGFKVTKINIKKSDILFLFTDGIEEAKRMFRTSDLEIHICAEPGLKQDEVHGNHMVGQDNEELGPERVTAIIEAVLNKSIYTLQKWHNPIPQELFEFDFTTAEGTIEEAILALVSIEKIFRMYSNPKATEFDQVQVDRKVDNFLNRYFKQYEHYCSRRKNHPGYEEYLYYTHASEDEQYDDLTLLAVKRI